MNTARLDLREQQNPGCLSCDRMARKDFLENGRGTQTVSVLDQLPVRCVGDWSYDKIYRLVKYFGIFASVDVVEALNKRIAAANATGIAEAIIGNYQDGPGIDRLLAKLPPNCLSLVFIDPTECDVPFTTVKTIIRHLKNADLIINVALRTDVNRNLHFAVTDRGFSKVRAKYESFLGVPGFCQRPDILRLAQVGAHDDLRRHFMDEYLNSLKAEGYIYTDFRPVEHYYHLLFASRSPKGDCRWRIRPPRPIHAGRMGC